jgi:hypothetical protein
MRRYRIGRADTNDIVLTDSTVSREHAELAELGEGRFAIKDLGSTYGIAIRTGEQWEKVAEAELLHDSPLRIGDIETSAAELLRDADRTVVRPHAPRHATPADAGSASAGTTAPPAPARTAPPRPAPPRPAPPRPAAPSRPGQNTAGPPAPPLPAAPAFQLLRDLPPEKRPLVWLGIAFAAFLLIALITLILALVL